MKAPTVAVLTPFLPEHEPWLRRAHASVIAQTYPNVRHVVWEDARHQGIPYCLNRMLERLDGDIDAWFCLGADDTLTPDCIAHHVEAWLAHDRKPHLVYGHILGVDEAGNALPGHVPGQHAYDRASLLAGRPQLPSGALHNINLWSLVGPYDEQLTHGREDWVWFVKCATLLPDFWPLPIEHCGYRHTKRAGSLTSGLKWFQDEFEAGLKRARIARGGATG
jgi:hypothetical protein